MYFNVLFNVGPDKTYHENVLPVFTILVDKNGKEPLHVQYPTNTSPDLVAMHFDEDLYVIVDTKDLHEIEGHGSITQAVHVSNCRTVMLDELEEQYRDEVLQISKQWGTRGHLLKAGKMSLMDPKYYHFYIPMEWEKYETLRQSRS